jgi:hypothetical protein
VTAAGQRYERRPQDPASPGDIRRLDRVKPGWKNPVIFRLLLASMAPRFVSRNTNTFL